MDIKDQTPREGMRDRLLKLPWRENLLLFTTILVILVIAYQPILQGYFVFNDDCFIWEMDKSRGVTTHPQFYFFFAIGRVFFPLIARPLWMSVDTVRGLNFGRFVNVFALAIAAFIFCRWLQRNSISRIFVVDRLYLLYAHISNPGDLGQFVPTYYRPSCGHYCGSACL